ncbi:MAG: hypothetical protein ACO1RX_22670 [Candidatus Sericytochromatia bacterium]
MNRPRLGVFIGLFLAGLCMYMGISLFWTGTLRLVSPALFAKPDNDPLLNVMMVLASACLIGLGLLTWDHIRSLGSDG